MKTSFAAHVTVACAVCGDGWKAKWRANVVWRRVFLLHATTMRGPVCTLGVLSKEWVCCVAWGGRKEGGRSKRGSQDCDQCRPECDTLCG